MGEKRKKKKPAFFFLGRREYQFYMVIITNMPIVWLKTKTVISQSSGGWKFKKVRKYFLSSFFLQLVGHLLCLHVPFSLFRLESHPSDFI